MRKSSIGIVLSVMGLTVCGSALAQSTVWNWGTGTGSCDPSTCTVGGTTATVSGYGAESTGALVQGATVKDLDPYSGVGLGITSCDPPVSCDYFPRKLESIRRNHVIIRVR